MATDELTAEQVQEICAKDEGSNLIAFIARLAKSHESLRADRDRLREERDALKKAAELFSNAADDFEHKFIEARARLRDSDVRLTDELIKLLEEIAAKDAIFRTMYEFDGDPWTHGSADLGWNQVALSFICHWCHASIDGNWPLRGDKPPHPDNGCPRNAIVAAPADEGKTCAPMEDWRGANDDWRKR